MPVYEYRCRDCSHEFEITQSMADDALTVCPECSGNLRKVFAPVGIAFKGSGFYRNDARSGKSSGHGGSSSGSDSASKSSDSSSSKSSSTTSESNSDSSGSKKASPAPSSTD